MPDLRTGLMPQMHKTSDTLPAVLHPQAAAGDSARTLGLYTLAVTGLLGLLAAAGHMSGQAEYGLMAGALVLGLVCAWRIEIGVFCLAALIPWEVHTRISEYFTLVKALGILITFFGIIHLIATRGPRWPTAMKFAAAFGIWGAIATFANPASYEYAPIYDAMRRIVTFLSHVFLMYVIMRWCATPSTLLVLTSVIVISSFGQALLGLVAYDWAMGHALQQRLTTDEVLNVNTYVRLLFPGIFLAPAVMSRVRTLPAKAFFLAGITSCIGASILTLSRGAVVGVGVGMFAWVMSAFRLPFKAKASMAFVLVVVLSLGFFWAEQQGVMQLWGERFSASQTAAALQSRTWRLAAGLDIALDNALIGVGMGNEGMAYALRGLPMTESHNDVLSSFIRYGAVGLFCYLGIIAGLYYGLVRMPASASRSCMIAFLTAIVLTGMFNPSLNSKILWFTLGTAAATIVVGRAHKKTAVYHSSDKQP